MRIHLINPSHVSFGIAVITPRWLYVLAAATPSLYGDPRITDETLEQFDPQSVNAGDVVGIGIHTGNALRGYEVGRIARDRGAWVVYGGIHATLYPEEALTLGMGHAIVKGDGDIAWGQAIEGCLRGETGKVWEGGKIAADRFLKARWDLLPPDRYMWASVQTVRGCPKHCSFCSVWRTDGQEPRQRAVDAVLEEVVELRRRGFRFIALADDNFYPVTLRRSRAGGTSRRSRPAERAESAARGTVRVDGEARQAAGRHEFFHADHHGSRGRSRILRTRCAMRASKGRSSAWSR